MSIKNTVKKTKKSHETKSYSILVSKKIFDGYFNLVISEYKEQLRRGETPTKNPFKEVDSMIKEDLEKAIAERKRKAKEKV